MKSVLNKLSWLLFIFRTQTMYKAQAEAEKIKVQKQFFSMIK